MALSLLIILVVIGVSAAAPELTRLRDFDWFRRWVEALSRQLNLNVLWTHALGLLITVGLPTLLVLLVHRALGSAIFGLIGILIAAIVLYYSWGPRDLDADVSDLATATDPELRQRALAALGASAEDNQPADRVELVFHQALKRWFGVLFWFVLFGPAAAIGFRLVQLLNDSKQIANQLPLPQVEAARRLYEALAFLPAQLMTGALALAGDFNAVSKAWREHHASHGQGLLHLDLGFLTATGMACIEYQDVDEVEDADPREQVAEQALQLVWRVLVVWLTVLAVIVLARLLG